MTKKKTIRARKNKNSLFHRLNYRIIGIIGILMLLASVFAVFTLSSEVRSSLTSWTSATQTISFLKSGTELFFEVKVDGVKDLAITFKEDVKSIVLVTEEVDVVSWDFQGVVYSRFKVSSADADKVDKVKFTLRIKPEELDKWGISLTELKIYREGQEVPTTFLSEEGDFAYYTAEASGIGEFVIGKKEEVSPEPKTPEETITPGLEVSAEKPTETTTPAPEEKELPLVGKATSVGEEEKGFFGKVGDFFKGLFE